MKMGNIITGVFFILLGTVFFVASLSFGAGTSGDVGSGFIPRLVSGAMILFAIRVIIVEIKQNSKEILLDSPTKKALFVILLTCLYLVIMNIVGFLIATPFLIAATLYMVKERAVLKLILIPVALTVLIYVCFKIGLNVQLPQTFLGF